MGFYVSSTADDRSSVYARLEGERQDTRIKICFDDFMVVLNDFLCAAHVMPDDQFERLLDAAGAIQSLSVLRAADAVCVGCDGENCVSCQNFKTITRQK